MDSDSDRSGDKRRSERGVTLVEYALLVAVFALGTLGAVNQLQNVSQAKVQGTANAISHRGATGD